MSCLPSYTYTPDFIASDTPCAAPIYQTHRSRLTTPGDGTTSTAMFFRSQSQNNEANLIELELTGTSTGHFNIYYDGTLVKTYTTAIGSGTIANLRSLMMTDPNSYIEMPELNVDIYDLRTTEIDGGTLPTDPSVDSFARTFMTGGAGAPTDATSLATIRTGPSRTIYIIRSKEDATGADVSPSPSEKIQQWNGVMWISYCNNVQGACPGEGTC